MFGVVFVVVWLFGVVFVCCMWLLCDDIVLVVGILYDVGVCLVGCMNVWFVGCWLLFGWFVVDCVVLLVVVCVVCCCYVVVWCCW